jgi:hypothetical protein
LLDKEMERLKIDVLIWKFFQKTIDKS